MVATTKWLQLEQVRVQERRKNEEKTSILNQLQHFQQADSVPSQASGAPAATVSSSTNSSSGDDVDPSNGLDDADDISAKAPGANALPSAVDATVALAAGKAAAGGEQGEVEQKNVGETQEGEQE